MMYKNKLCFSLSLVIVLAFTTVLSAQRDRSQLSPEFQEYLTTNSLWDQWEGLGSDFDCPHTEEQHIIDQPITENTTPKPKVSISEAQEALAPRIPEEELITIEQVIAHDQVTPFTRISASSSAMCILNKGEEFKEEYNQNPDFFEEKRLTILKTFTNFPDSLKDRNKFIVLDITASMGPYAEEVLLWQAMSLAEDGEKKYVFFNDGDRKTTYEKEMGSTGGLYLARGETAADLETITREMSKGMNNGGGGDIPENDVEGLIYAQKLMKKDDILILVADAGSPMRDFFLYEKLDVPVHIILCGYVTKGKIPAQYAALAALTGGSIHSMEEDIWNISERLDGKQITIDGLPYLIEDQELKTVGRAVIPND